MGSSAAATLNHCCMTWDAHADACDLAKRAREVNDALCTEAGHGSRELQKHVNITCDALAHATALARAADCASGAVEALWVAVTTGAVGRSGGLEDLFNPFGGRELRKAQLAHTHDEPIPHVCYGSVAMPRHAALETAEFTMRCERTEWRNRMGALHVSGLLLELLDGAIQAVRKDYIDRVTRGVSEDLDAGLEELLRPPTDPQ